MHLDIRTPLGLMFLIIGIVLFAYGFISDPAIYHRSFNINVNLIWGAVLAAFGFVMLLMVWLKVKKSAQIPQQSIDHKKDVPALK